jgi:predicted amidohydrolase
MTPQEAEEVAVFHHKLVMQSNSYMNSCFSVSAAKAGLEDGKYVLIGGSCITSPEGYVLAEAKTKDDEIVFAKIDLEDCRQGKEKTFDFDRHRRIDQYPLITLQTGVIEPELL